MSDWWEKLKLPSTHSLAAMGFWFSAGEAIKIEFLLLLAQISLASDTIPISFAPMKTTTVDDLVFKRKCRTAFDLIFF